MSVDFRSNPISYRKCMLTDLFFALSIHKSTKVIVDGLTIEQAIGACYLHGTIPLTTLYSRVQARRDKGTYDVLIRKSIQDKLDMVIDVTGDNKARNILPITMNSATSSSLTTMITTSWSTSKRTRCSPRQASAHA